MIIPLEKFWAFFVETPCNKQRKLVEKEWPNGIPLNSETIQRALELKLDISWIGMCLPDPLDCEYAEKRVLLDREYNEKCTQLWRAYEEKGVLLFRAYDEKNAPLLLKILIKQF